MQGSLNKNIYRGILIISFIAVNAFILFGISNILAFLNTGADRSTMLHVELKSKDVYLPKVNWTSLENPGRPIEMPTLNKIEQDYLDAWYVRNVTYKTNNPYGIEDFYTDSARVNIFETIKLNKPNKIHIDATSISHQPKLEFYSADGQLVVFTDEEVVEYQKVFQNNNLVLTTEDTTAYKVMMLLEDGFWRIRHIEKIIPEKTKINPQIESFVKVEKGQIIVNEKPFIIKGINYYPQASPWDMFGNSFDESVIEKDFNIIKNSNLNSIRIFVQYEDFGKAVVKPEKLEKLKKTLDLAEKVGLKVVVTLFDFYGDYSILNWTLTHRHAEQIVSAFKDHKSIIAWDIKNEPDLDFESRNKETVKGWLTQMIKEIKKFDRNHLITIGYSSPEAALNLIDQVDFISYHFYKNINHFEADYKMLKKATNKPLVIQEFGLSSYRGLWNFYRGSDIHQANYHKKMQENFKKESLAFMSWSLYDFNQIPTSVVGRLPWRKSQQKYFGFIDENGNKKPSFEYISY